MGKKIALCVLLALVAAAALLQNIYVRGATEELVKGLEEVRSALQNDDFASARAAADSFAESWENKKDMFEAFFEHKEVDSISAAAATIRSLCYTGSKEDALAQIAGEVFYIEHIRDIDGFRWQNIF